MAQKPFEVKLGSFFPGTLLRCQCHSIGRAETHRSGVLFGKLPESRGASFAVLSPLACGFR